MHGRSVWRTHQSDSAGTDAWTDAMHLPAGGNLVRSLPVFFNLYVTLRYKRRVLENFTYEAHGNPHCKKRRRLE
ncbi:hypothetical protein ALQ07_102055 [Pseudomonas syringae pv. actinidiae]|uniref:Uncharacterized protein n=3 Tax=Pseudomonas syringae TaxID=317 RepID=A0A3M4K2W7_PSESF|nr:hypothetical protein ALQ07_102055 [Pseudomonas syringae pv. actinidiae]RMT61946.1 hypothetical protein ALP44_101878 [Pseudomonas syringae pv. theae]